MIKKLIQKAAFKYFLKEKERHSKLNEITYSELRIQPYLVDNRFTKEERDLMISLRSRCHDSKNNFKKLYKNDIYCRYGCKSIESQIHLLTQCITLSDLKPTPNHSEYTDIYKDSNRQKEAIQYFILIEKVRKQLRENLKPGPDTSIPRA